jgi:tRNA modification GTPase
MTLDLDDTIVAIASAPGGALRGIVRLSGPDSAACVATVFRASDETGSGVFGGRSSSIMEDRSPPKTPDPFSVNGELTLPRSLGPIPARLYLWPDRRSYTRQPAAELHMAGSPPLLEAVVESLCQAGARLARPGEFTLRAFLAGRLDLTQAEAVLGVIDARGQAQLDTALAQLAGGLAGPLAALRERLLDLLAHLEAGLDFAEEDIEFITPVQLDAQLAAAANEVQQLAQRMHSRRDTTELPRVVLVGAPNAGKSSLFNALAGSDAAIVSDVAGTTRDYVTCRLTAGGQEFLLVDTAGETSANEDASINGLAQVAAAHQRRPH